jgi:RimJ/RimL family protein N-acetyltransferase
MEGASKSRIEKVRTVISNEDSNTGSVFLSSKQIYLRALEKEDLPLLQKWANDAEIRELTGEVTPTSFSGMQEFFEKVQTDSSRIWFVIVLKGTDRVIGETGLLRMFHPWRTTDLSIILGDKTAWGKGYGAEALYLLLDYAFGYLNFHRVSIGVVASNERAIRFYEKAGFKKEGIQREGYYHNHAYQDFVMMSILENEFRERYREPSKIE